MKIYAPVRDFNGVHASVQFVNGVGETDNPHLIEWFRSHGYKVPVEETNLVIEPKIDEIEVENDQVEIETDESPNFESMTPNELRDLAKARGKGHLIKNIRNKEKLIEILRG